MNLRSHFHLDLLCRIGDLIIDDTICNESWISVLYSCKFDRALVK